MSKPTPKWTMERLQYLLACLYYEHHTTTDETVFLSAETWHEMLAENVKNAPPLPRVKLALELLRNKGITVLQADASRGRTRKYGIIDTVPDVVEQIQTRSPGNCGKKYASHLAGQLKDLGLSSARRRTKRPHVIITDLDELDRWLNG